MRRRSKKHIDIFNYKQRLLSIDMKTKVVQHVSRIIFNVFKVVKFSGFQVFKFSKFSGSQRLSDFQTFFACHMHRKLSFKFVEFSSYPELGFWYHIVMVLHHIWKLCWTDKEVGKKRKTHRT